MENQVLDRSKISKDLKWDLSLLMKPEDFNKSLEQLETISKDIEKSYKGNLNNPETIVSCLKDLEVFSGKMSRTGSYSYLQLSVDQGDPNRQKLYMKGGNIFSQIYSRMSFIEAEILKNEEAIIKSAIGLDGSYKNYLEDLLNKKDHSLGEDVERVISALSPTINGAYSVYDNAKLVDMTFPTLEVDGEKYPMTFGVFEEELEINPNTKVRRLAFEEFHKVLRAYENTIASAYQTHVQTEKTISDLRAYKNVYESLLDEQKVDMAMYNRQIDLIMTELAPHMRKYANLIKKIYKLDKMTFADLKVSIDPEYDPQITIEESKEYIFGALSVMGEEYLDIMKKAYDNRWIDFAKNKGKSTGAFCATPYGSNPFILTSFSGGMKEVFTLAHELGHAGHFYLMHENQNIFNSDISTYFVEAPSTMNEILMGNYLMENAKDSRMKRWVLSTIVGNTYYHNFVTHLLEAAYQREVYKIIEEGGSVQASSLNEIKRNVLEEFWGDAVEITEGAELTWMRQPHYYMGLYPYTYSAGLTVATEVSKKVLEDKKNIEPWLDTLRAGGSKTPLELAQMAGVDISTEEPLRNTIEHIGRMIDEIISLTEEIEA